MVQFKPQPDESFKAATQASQQTKYASAQELADAGKQFMPTVPQMLRDLAHIYAERNPQYGDNYKHGGEILKAMFPDGIILRSAEEFNRMHLLIMMMSKLSRYAAMLTKGGHVDSLNDIAVYAMLARECDMEDELRRAGVQV